MTVYPPVSVFLGDCGQLELGWGELAERSLASPTVVGVLIHTGDRTTAQTCPSFRTDRRAATEAPQSQD
jgi:hypothetical protein